MSNINNQLLTKLNAHFIRLQPNEKKPMFAHEPALSKEQLLQAERKNYNIALTADSKFVFIDLNTTNGRNSQNGVTAFKSWLEANDIDSEQMLDNYTLMGTTPTGGVQLVFLQNNLPYIGQHLDLLGNDSGIDIKGADNNYIVCEPSITTNGKYLWANTVEPVILPEKLDRAIRNII